MTFFADLNCFTITVTVIITAMSVAVLWYTASNSPTKFGGVYGALLGAALACIPMAHDAYCPDADQPHIRAIGWMFPVHSYTYHSGKSTYDGLIACMDVCTPDTPRLALNHRAMHLLQSGPGAYSVVYLGRTEEANIGNGQVMIAHPVVQIYDVRTGDRLAYTDTRRHWPRVIVYLSNALIAIATFCASVSMIRRNRKRDSGETDDQPDDGAPRETEMTKLNLGA